MEEMFLNRLLDIPTLYGGALSPNGQWLAFLSRGNFAPVTQLYIVSADGQGQARQILGETEGWDCDGFHWSPDSCYLLVAQSRDGNELVRFMLANAENGQWRQLTNEQAGIFIHGGVIDPNNRYIVYSANQDPDTGRPIEESVIYRRDIEKGEGRALARLLAPAPFGTPRISPDGKNVLYYRADLHPAGSQIWLVDIEGKEDREIANFGANVKAWGVWSKDGKSILILAEARTHRRMGLYRMESHRTEWLIDDPSRDLSNIYWPEASPVSMLAEYRNGRLCTSLLDLARGEEKKLVLPGATITALGQNGKGEWVINRYDARRPDQYFLAELSHNGKVTQGKALSILSQAKSIHPDELAAMEDFYWHSVDGLKIHAWLTRARGRARGTILYIHGGPTYHTEDEFSVQVQYLARCGFHVVQPNYRGSTGFGFPFQESIKQQGWGGLEQEDIRTCAEALIEAGIAEKGKIGITGVSYGGYSSWWAITHHSTDLIAASMPICGMTDLVVDYEGTRPDLRSYSEEMLGGSPSEVPQRYFERSPINFVNRIKGKLLIVQGMTDPNVTPLNLIAVRKKLDEAKIPYEVLAFEDEGHGIAKPANRKKLYLRMADFFASAFDPRISSFSPETQKVGVRPVS